MRGLRRLIFRHFPLERANPGFLRHVKDNKAEFNHGPAKARGFLGSVAQFGCRLSPDGLMVTVPAPLMVTDCVSADQVSGLPPVAASNSPA